MKYVDEYYPYVCTCQEETDKFSELAGKAAAALTVMSGCTAEAQKSAANGCAGLGGEGSTTMFAGYGR